MPACEHPENTNNPLSFTRTAMNRSSMISGSGSHDFPSAPCRMCPGKPTSYCVTRGTSPLTKNVPSAITRGSRVTTTFAPALVSRGGSGTRSCASTAPSGCREPRCTNIPGCMKQSTRPRAFTIASTAVKSPPPWSQCPCESTAASAWPKSTPRMAAFRRSVAPSGPASKRTV